MLNTIRLYLFQNHPFISSSSHRDYYQNAETWHQQRNHHVNNWLSDMAANQHSFHELENRQHFWNSGPKEQHYSDPSRQSNDSTMYLGSHDGLKNKSSQKSMSTLFNGQRNEDDYGRSKHQQQEHYATVDSPNSSLYQRQRHELLPSSQNPLHHYQQQQQQFLRNGGASGNSVNPFMNMDRSGLKAAATTATSGLRNPLLTQQYHHQQQQQQKQNQQQQQQQQQHYQHQQHQHQRHQHQHYQQQYQQQQLHQNYNRHLWPMHEQLYDSGMTDHCQHQQIPQNHYRSRNNLFNLFKRHGSSRIRNQNHSDQYSVDNSSYTNSYHSQEQQQQKHALNYYQQQQQPYHAYPSKNNMAYYGGGISGNFGL
ncbi:hypothetical protein BD408DRAFT_410655 [Parasitella parasitica]|nr:hypothetical protein BD408DRAFT_410655 [Parasitella parasitica]